MKDRIPSEITVFHSFLLARLLREGEGGLSYHLGGENLQIFIGDMSAFVAIYARCFRVFDYIRQPAHAQ